MHARPYTQPTPLPGLEMTGEAETRSPAPFLLPDPESKGVYERRGGSGVKHPGRSPSGITFPQRGGLSVGPKVRGQAPAARAARAPPPTGLADPGFPRTVLFPRSGPQNYAKEPKHRPQDPARGRVQAAGLRTGRSRARQVPQGCRRGAVSLSSPRAPRARAPRGVGIGSLFFFGDHLAQQVWSGPP